MSKEVYFSLQKAGFIDPDKHYHLLSKQDLVIFEKAFEEISNDLLDDTREEYQKNLKDYRNQVDALSSELDALSVKFSKLAKKINDEANALK